MITLILLMLGTVSIAQVDSVLYVTTDTTQFADYDNQREEHNIVARVHQASMFKIQSDMSSFEHKITGNKTVYFCENVRYNEKKNRLEMDCYSENGNKYYAVMTETSIAFLSYSDLAISEFFIKSRWWEKTE
jgi:hypothetical protein